ncbi:hypothetical protein CHK_1459 [Christensenella hongkongensis]|uniref:Uncharacterized protein n=1 Tax=Christensenella hongkongensis TaxID=270498 RepID=A0A0M2NKW6_9FIRM|nr:hypothetical protein CHK_1459 [Christensenella hongkongensis]
MIMRTGGMGSCFRNVNDCYIQRKNIPYQKEKSGYCKD